MLFGHTSRAESRLTRDGFNFIVRSQKIVCRAGSVLMEHRGGVIGPTPLHQLQIGLHLMSHFRHYPFMLPIHLRRTLRIPFDRILHDRLPFQSLYPILRLS